jgi:hypothetical protein
MDLINKDLICVIIFGFYMKKQAKRKTHLGTPKASRGLWYVERSIVGERLAIKNG